MRKGPQINCSSNNVYLQIRGGEPKRIEIKILSNESSYLFFGEESKFLSFCIFDLLSILFRYLLCLCLTYFWILAFVKQIVPNILFMRLLRGSNVSLTVLLGKNLNLVSKLNKVEVTFLILFMVIFEIKSIAVFKKNCINFD